MAAEVHSCANLARHRDWVCATREPSSWARPAGDPKPSQAVLQPVGTPPTLHVADNLVSGSETIILDAGTTTVAIAKEIMARRLPVTVLTNSVPLVNALGTSPQLHVFVAGGEYRDNIGSLVADWTERSFSEALRKAGVFVQVVEVEPIEPLPTETPPAGRGGRAPRRAIGAVASAGRGAHPGERKFTAAGGPGRDRRAGGTSRAGGGDTWTGGGASRARGELNAGGSYPGARGKGGARPPRAR